MLHDVKTLAVESGTRRPRRASSPGHSHKPALATDRDGVLFLNPGSIGPRRFTLPVAMARLTVRRRRRPRPDRVPRRLEPRPSCYAPRASRMPGGRASPPGARAFGRGGDMSEAWRRRGLYLPGPWNLGRRRPPPSPTPPGTSRSSTARRCLSPTRSRRFFLPRHLDQRARVGRGLHPGGAAPERPDAHPPRGRPGQGRLLPPRAWGSS